MSCNFKVLSMPLSSNVRMYCSKYSLSSMTTVRWWKLTCVVELGSVVYSAATSQFLPIPVPDVLFAIHVSTMWTTALGHCQTLRAVNRQDGRFRNMQCHQILKWHTLYHTHTGVHALQYAHSQLHRCTCGDTNGSSHWEAHWNMNVIICFPWLCSPPLL